MDKRQYYRRLFPRQFTDTIKGVFTVSRKRKNEFNENVRTYQQYFDRLTELATTVFEWEGLPDTVDPRYIELALFTEGLCIFFKDDVLGYLCLRGTLGGNFSVYDIPKTRYVRTDNGYQRTLNDKNSVIIFNNFLHKGSISDVDMFAKRLYNLDRTIDVNINAQKTPILIKASETQRLSLKNLYDKYEGNEPYIFGDSALNADCLEVLRTDAPFVADKLYALKTQIWNEFLTYVGISNVSVTKKERLVTDEVLRGQGGVIASRLGRLKSREMAVNEINKMFPELSIKCKVREEYSTNSEVSENE